MQQIKFPARPSLNRSLEGQRIVIIGGTSGFGMATAKAASAERASVVVASSKRTNVDRALDELPTGAEGHVFDITQESAGESLDLVSFLQGYPEPDDTDTAAARQFAHLTSLSIPWWQDARRFPSPN